LQLDRVNEYFNGDICRHLVFEFLDNPEHQAIFFREGKGGIEASDVPEKTPKGSLFYLVKLRKGAITETNIGKEIVYGEVMGDPIEYIATLTQKIYHPMISSKKTAKMWSETIAKEVRDRFDVFVANVQITQGHVQGVTCLPLPDESNFQSDTSFSMDSIDSHSQIHALESAIITWTKQIKNVLKQDPENMFVQQVDPGPMAEVEFWKNKAANLNGIFDQLQSEKVRRVLTILDKSKSTYNTPFAKLCKEVFHARAEANNIVRYLRPLVGWLEGLENETEFERLIFHFKPIMHITLLIWKMSAYYNTPSRLVILIRQLCNTIIRHASAYLNGDTIFELIDAGETQSAVKLLQSALRVVGKFKNAYFDQKAIAAVECPDNPWRVQNNAIFVRLDAFLERCHDILELAQTIVVFSKLSKIEVGGTKGKTLTTSIAQLYIDFTQAVDTVHAVGKGILDLQNKAFDAAFYEFRTRIKELDKRLGSVILQGFDDITTTGGKFRLLDTFDSLITRPLVADELEKKHAALIEAVRMDVEEVQGIFDHYKEQPMIAANLPPVAGALSWSRGLLERVQIPVEKLKTLDKKVLEREDTKDVIKMYTALIGQLADFDREKVENWGKGIEASSQSTLKNPLLRRDGDSQLLHVNFDSILVRLLREVKYFLLLGLSVPQGAMEIYEKSEVFRRHTGNLDLIVNMYNDIQTTLLPVERPLVKSQLERIDKTLAQGIREGGSKSKALNWKSNGIDLFIGETMTEVREVSDMLQLLKGNLKLIEQTVGLWQTQPIFERGTKTAFTNDFLVLQAKVRQTKLSQVKEAGQEIHRLLKDTNKRLKVSQGLPDWKAYVDFVNNVVVYGLVDAQASSLRAMASQFNPKYLEMNALPPLLEIQVDLIDSRVVFVPEIGFVAGDTQQLAKTGIKNIVTSWVNGMLGLASSFKRLDSSDGTYLKEILDSPEVQIQRAKVSKFLDGAEANANKLRRNFLKFEYLWATDIHQAFAEFLKEAVIVEHVPIVNPEADGNSANDQNAANAAAGGSNPVAASSAGTWARTTINRELFSEKIRYYVEVQTEVSELKSTYDSDFLKVNAQPVKQAIATWATKWLYVHTQYLQTYIGDQLVGFAKFYNTVMNGMEKKEEGGFDRETAMRTMTHIRDVRKRMPEFSTLFEPLKDIVALLKANSISIDLAPINGQTALDFLDQAKMLWENVVNKAFRVKEALQPIQNSMVEGIRREIKSFETAANKFIKEFKLNGAFGWLETKKTDAYDNIDKYQQQLMVLSAKAGAINELEDLFELPLSQHSVMKDVEDDLRALKNVWDMINLVDSLFTQWKGTLWAEIKTDDLLEEIKRIQVQIKRQPKKPREWGAFKRLEIEVKNMATILPLVHELHSHAMRDRHWKALMTITGIVFEKGPGFCLDNLISLNLHQHVESVSDMVEVANKELKIENRLNMIEETWARLSLKFDRHRDTEVFVISPPDEILETLEEHHLHLQSMAGMGKFVDFFRDQVVKWQATLGEVETNLKLLVTVQRQWGSLESIFLGSADIRAQLPDDSKRFEGVDTEFKEQMREIQTRSTVVMCCAAEGRETTLRNMFRELEKCEKALNEYLEIKKNIFPRFYFVSNAALLDILSNGNNPPKIMPHIGSVFDGVGDLELCLSATQARAAKEDPELNPGPAESAKSMISKDREVVPFPTFFDMKGAVENWLHELVRMMQLTLRGNTAASMADVAGWELEKPREEWIFTVPAQVALVTSQNVWTEEVESAMEELEGGQEDALKKYADLCSNRLEALIRLVQGELSKSDRVKIITVITIDVHNRDVVTTLVQKKVENNVDFKWQSQLRYYWLPEIQDVNIRICDFTTLYSFEYVGNCGRLVITPLTDRCYVTLTVALKLMLGGAPAGPAGTGKTETTKDLARGLGLPCYVFNCSDQMNYQTMGDIFKGLTQVGAWGCFDEFNRIEIEVLSVVASQVRCILDAIALMSIPANRAKEFQHLPAGNPPVKVGMFNFFGETISLIPTVGLFITMNPGMSISNS
jgi:dynein heavy chain